MSVLASPPQPSPPHLRPPSRSERLLRDTLRKDDTLRTTSSPPSHSRRRSRSACSDQAQEDEDFFESTLLFRSTKRNSAASVSSSQSRAHTHPRCFYIPDKDEHTSYVQLLRSPSFSGSSRSRNSESKSPQYTSLALETQEDVPLNVHDAPHEAVLRTRLEHVLHLGMREVRREKERETGTPSSAGSPPSSLLSLSNSRHSHESEHTHLTTPEGDAHIPSTPPPHALSNSNSQQLESGHRFTRSVSSAIPSSIDPRHYERASKSPPPTTPGKALSHTPQPRQKQAQNVTHTHSNSSWLTTPLPPSPPVFATKRASHMVAPVDASPPSLVLQTHSHPRTPAPTVQSPPRSPPTHRPHTPHQTHVRTHHSPHTPTPAFDPKAASLACQKEPGYVSFASVAGLGSPPDEDDRHSGRTIGFAGKNALLGFGGGKWWAF